MSIERGSSAYRAIAQRELNRALEGFQAETGIDRTEEIDEGYLYLGKLLQQEPIRQQLISIYENFQSSKKALAALQEKGVLTDKNAQTRMEELITDPPVALTIELFGENPAEDPIDKPRRKNCQKRAELLELLIQFKKDNPDKPILLGNLAGPLELTRATIRWHYKKLAQDYDFLPAVQGRTPPKERRPKTPPVNPYAELDARIKELRNTKEGQKPLGDKAIKELLSSSEYRPNVIRNRIDYLRKHNELKKLRIRGKAS